MMTIKDEEGNLISNREMYKRGYRAAQRDLSEELTELRSFAMKIQQNLKSRDHLIIEKNNR